MAPAPSAPIADADDPFAALEGALQREVDAVLTAADDVPPRAAVDEPVARRGKMIAAGVLGLIVLGGLGAFAYNGLTGDGGSGEPVLIAADEDPLKIRPDQPGGETIPHQNTLIFDRASGENTGDDNARIVSREETVAALPTPVAPPKTDDRVVGTAVQPRVIEPSAVRPNDDPNAPRRVRTMIVRPDGTIVRADDPAPTAAPTAVVPAPAVVPQPAQTAAVPPATDTAQPDPATPVADTDPAAAANQAAVDPNIPLPIPRPAGIQPRASAPAPVSTAAAQPAAQPTAPVSISPPAQQPAAQPQPAAAQPAVTQAAATGNYVVQLASRRSQEQALSTYASMQSQYPSILGSYSPLIERADLGDRGVFYRLRVGPVGTQANAATLCDQLKSAGLPDCFVRRN